MGGMLVSIRDLTLRLPSGGRTLSVLDGVSLDVDAGEAVAVAGPSGSGKSTLLGLVAGLDAPTSGTIVVAGVEVTRLGEAALARFRRETLGYVFQSYHLIPTLTAAENVASSTVYALTLRVRIIANEYSPGSSLAAFAARQSASASTRVSGSAGLG